jgi:hypothetical protein
MKKVGIFLLLIVLVSLVYAQDTGQKLGVRLPASGLGKSLKQAHPESFSCRSTGSLVAPVQMPKGQAITSNTALGVNKSYQALGSATCQDVRFSMSVSPQEYDRTGIKSPLGNSLSGIPLKK